ncbi:MAG: hypothetical protein CMH30_06745 [Micavibrio sp.]|nr:hypothetical protein [Micavibrio sp.]|tara:strand:- start:1514 stop:2347 length:834 start_codon:yes stop_codon:yes gene_type:complete
MTTTISNAFVKQFEREVHEAYQRQGSKLRGTVRTAGNVKGSTAVFQKIGKGVASTKSTHGIVPVMNLDHSSIEVDLQDYYAGDWVDRLDELKLNHDERSVIANAGAYALGRKTDELIINALIADAPAAVSDDTTGLTLTKVLEAFEALGENDVPDDGQRFCIVGYRQYSELLKLEEFASADYVGAEELPFRGAQAKKWLGTTFIPHSGLPIDENDIRTCFWYHKSAIGHASGSDVETNISYHNDRASFFVNNMMSQGAKVVDATGIVTLSCDETPDA